MFNVHLEKSEAKILIWEACSSEHMWQGCITSPAPKVLTLKYQAPPAPLWTWSDKYKTSRHGFETLGPFARADQTHAIVGSLCQNSTIVCIDRKWACGRKRDSQPFWLSNRWNRTETSLYPHVQIHFKAFVALCVENNSYHTLTVFQRNIFVALTTYWDVALGSFGL